MALPYLTGGPNQECRRWHEEEDDQPDDHPGLGIGQDRLTQDEAQGQRGDIEQQEEERYPPAGLAFHQRADRQCYPGNDAQQHPHGHHAGAEVAVHRLFQHVAQAIAEACLYPVGNGDEQQPHDEEDDTAQAQRQAASQDLLLVQRESDQCSQHEWQEDGEGEQQPRCQFL